MPPIGPLWDAGNSVALAADCERMTVGLYRNRSTRRSPDERYTFRGAVRIEP
jgi:hypothetical protein